jgi:heme-degrading monooxygenase HmoA
VSLADTPEPPYVAVIFTSLRSDDGVDYLETDAALLELVAQQPGYLGVEAVDDGTMGISVSYWATDADARAWKQVADHVAAQKLGRERWYRAYAVRVATVERAYDFTAAAPLS